ncbi:MAG TPA: hypothetical protein VJT84_14105 [Gaiellaceae bacterium]|nr:hypothetical protein [Gaiellaceae bacterium]
MVLRDGFKRRPARTAILLASILAAGAVGGYWALGSSAVTPPPALVTIDPSKASYTLPATFWGVVERMKDIGAASRAPDYVRYARALHPEVVRYSAACNPGTPAEPAPCMQVLQRYADLLTPTGAKIYLQMQTEPLDRNGSPDDPANVQPYGSPDAQAAWLADWAARYGAGNIVAVEWTNEPQARGGQDGWFHGDKAKIGQWLTTMQAAYNAKLHEALPTVDVLGMAWAPGGAGTLKKEDVLPAFVGSTVPSGELQVLSVHGYGQREWNSPIPLYSDFRNPADPTLHKKIDQDKMNHYFYLPYLPGKSGYQASFGEWRRLLDTFGGQGTRLALTEYAYFHPGPPGALADVATAIISANNQKNWNLAYVVAHALTLDDKDLDPTHKKDHGPSILLAKLGCRTSTGKCVVRSSRYFAFQQLVGPFLHNYKLQIGQGGIRVAGAGPTPSSARANSVTKIQAAAGLSADGRRLGVLIGNFDLYNTQSVTLNLAGKVSGLVKATRLPNNHSYSSNQPFPVTYLKASAATASTGSNLNVNFGPGEAYLLEVPLSAPVTPATP